jgi:uncharacterized protein DUF4185
MAEMRRRLFFVAMWFAASACTAAIAANLLPPFGPRPVPVIAYQSTSKLNQLNGERDKQFQRPTLSRTVTRYGLRGSDLGYSFEHQGRVYFLFGDTVGVEGGALDSIATSDATDPTGGVRLDYVSPRAGTYLTVQPPGITMGAFDVPVSGISLGGQMYVIVKTNHPNDETILTKVAFPMTPTGFTPLGAPISRLPNGRFLKISMHEQPGQIVGLPPGGPFVLMWGTGVYRNSDAYLSLRPVATFESGKGTLYFHGFDASGAPSWRSNESAAVPIVKNGTMGDLSVTWCKDLGLWLMTYDGRSHGRSFISFSYSPLPWGPWTTPQVIFDEVRDRAMGTFIHDPTVRPNDGLAGPVIGKRQAKPNSVPGGVYAPYVVERWTTVQGSSLFIYFVMSTWNPYVVDLMTTRFSVSSGISPHTPLPRPTLHPVPHPVVSYPI